MKRVLEICANSAQSCVEAEMGGAARVELCAGIPEGGTTPSYGEIRMAQQLTEAIDINVLIRPRGGDFLYTENEVQSMLYDIEMCKDLNVHGVVFGCLQENGDLDIDLMERLKDAAGTLSVTCHRAFDVCRDPFKTMEELVRLGVDRILTSGQQAADSHRGDLDLTAGIGCCDISTRLQRQCGLGDLDSNCFRDDIIGGAVIAGEGIVTQLRAGGQLERNLQLILTHIAGRNRHGLAVFQPSIAAHRQFVRTDQRERIVLLALII